MNSPKPRIALFGRHSSRTPFAYETYRKSLSTRLDFVGLDDHPHLIITGFSKDLFDAIGNGLEDYLKSQDSKLLVVSEEPLWDTIYAPQCQEAVFDNVAAIKGTDIRFNFFNHLNSDLYEYNRIPYYLTTSANYLTRYTVLMNSILSSYSPSFFADKASEPVFGMFEKRIESWFDYNIDHVQCLCIYRSLLGQELQSDARISGLGHAGSVSPRQKLPDWHLDKLARSYRKHGFVIAMENTCHKDYVTEKIFDAYAVGAIPIYYAPSDHTVRSNIGLSSFVDVSGLEPKEAALAIMRKRSNINEGVDQFFDDLRLIVDNVLEPSNYWDEIKVRSDKLIKIALECMQ